MKTLANEYLTSYMKENNIEIAKKIDANYPVEIGIYLPVDKEYDKVFLKNTIYGDLNFLFKEYTPTIIGNIKILLNKASTKTVKLLKIRFAYNK